MRALLIASTLGLLVLSGCATLSKNECQLADWYQIGYEDGASGYSDMRLADHRKACAKHGVQADTEMYAAGHGAGIERFCTPARGYREGENGNRYNAICPSELDGPFYAAYQAGREIYDAKSTIRWQKGEISRLQEELQTVRQQITSKEALLLSNGPLPEEIDRNVLYVEINALKEQEKELEVNAGKAEKVLEQQRTQLALLQSKPRPF